MYGYLTGLEYLQFAGSLRGMPDDQVNEKANEVLELLNLQEARWDQAYRTSGVLTAPPRFDIVTAAKLPWQRHG